MRSLKCLGTGTGSSNFLTGQPSSAYLLQTEGSESMLMDCGAGVGRVVLAETGGVLVRNIYLSHNHSDHTGDLPVYLALMQAQSANPVNLYGHRDVLDIIDDHRLHELKTHGSRPAVMWHKEDSIIRLPDCGLQLELLRTGHSYLCYGFLMRDLVSGEPVLGWTADGPFDEDLYAHIAQAPIIIAHSRPDPSADHAAFEEVACFAESHPEKQFYLSHYEQGAVAPDVSNVALLESGMTLNLP